METFHLKIFLLFGTGESINASINFFFFFLASKVRMRCRLFSTLDACKLVKKPFLYLGCLKTFDGKERAGYNMT
jgi:hypothetical protein